MGIGVFVDTNKVAKRLQKAGATPELAEVVAEEVAKAGMRDSKYLATKSDLQATENRLIKWMVGLLIAFSAIILVTMVLALH